MAARPVAMTGVLYPLNKKDPPVPCYICGNAWDPRLSIWSEPIIPALPSGPVDPGYSPPWAQVPEPPVNPPIEPPQPGGPVTPVPPPEGSAGWPVQPIAVPPFVIINYPGV